MTVRVLTGITTTGTPHLGNYVGAIRPAIAASRRPGVESFLFLADYHALVKCDDPARVERSRLVLAATWLAAGLDPDRVTFYRQSDIPEIPELTWLLTCVTPKGLMNRAHAYKAAVDANQGGEPDDGVNLGLFCYPVLMAADILMFNAHQVPVGKDQVQHIEMARDIAQRFNHLYGHEGAQFTLPEAVSEQTALLPGLDGRKMSKSYDNTIPLFEGGAQGLQAAIARVVTDSRLPGEPKDAEGAHLVVLFDAFASDAERASFRAGLLAGLAWGEAKKRLFDVVDRELAPQRARFETLMAHPERIEEQLQAGARKARGVATPFLARLREAVGLRRFQATTDTTGTPAAAGTVAAPLPTFKQYRESDGLFYFKLVSPGGDAVLLQSRGFEQGREAGAWVARLKKEGAAALAEAPVTLATDVATVRLALERFTEAGQDAA
ncbi:MAG TPA: tryptophan--tRNA ligase [Burkholderiaceae bacterium]|nr:tryptophan--tRNA ligase [Burkholderiaceae bacterium]